MDIEEETWVIKVPNKVEKVRCVSSLLSGVDTSCVPHELAALSKGSTPMLNLSQWVNLPLKACCA